MRVGASDWLCCRRRTWSEPFLRAARPAARGRLLPASRRDRPPAACRRCCRACCGAVARVAECRGRAVARAARDRAHRRPHRVPRAAERERGGARAAGRAVRALAVPGRPDRRVPAAARRAARRAAVRRAADARRAGGRAAQSAWRTARSTIPSEQVEALRKFQRAAMFRIAVAGPHRRLPLMKVSDRLTGPRRLLVQAPLDLAWQQIVARHGVPLCGPADERCARRGVIVVAYGKFGGIELGYGSDLDLVFLHDSARRGPADRRARTSSTTACSSCGSCSGSCTCSTVHSAAGRLYEVDTRLRPSGKGGLLVQSIEGFADYQRDGRMDLGAPGAAASTRRRRRRCACASRSRRCAVDAAAHGGAPRRRCARTCARCANGCGRSCRRRKPGEFDLKQDAGGITDIEFLAQYWSLLWSDRSRGAGDATPTTSASSKAWRRSAWCRRKPSTC